MKTIRTWPLAAAICSALLAPATALAQANAEGNAEAGAKAFRFCQACHSLEKGRHMTGPSLADIWERKAGTVDGFVRYSKALKSAKLVWDAKTLDAWLADPRALVPGNTMTFRGMRDEKARADLIAFLKSVAAASRAGRPTTTARRRMRIPDLKTLNARHQVTAIRHCGDTYFVSTAAGKTIPFWEYNLRLKTDSGDTGPHKGKPVIVGSGMQGDRASVVFASSAEISAFIERKC